MKKIKLLICLLLILTLTGCVKYDLGNTVGSNKEFTLTIVNALLNEYYNKESLAESTKQYQDLGYKVEDYIGSKYSGLKLIKEYKSIDDVSTTSIEEVELIDLLKTNTNDIKLFKVEKNGNISKYTANLVYDLTTESLQQETQQDYSEYAETMYFGYSIALPTNAKVITHNADKTEQDGQVLLWEVEYGTKKNIKFSFELDSSKQGNTIIRENNDEQQTNNEEINDNESDTVINNNKKVEDINPISTIFSLIVVCGIVGGFVYLKVKAKEKIKKKKSDPTILYHAKPPKR